MASSEIKDKTDITNARKEIERRMERFKLVEKEAKTKSFSKVGAAGGAVAGVALLCVVTGTHRRSPAASVWLVSTFGCPRCPAVAAAGGPEPLGDGPQGARQGGDARLAHLHGRFAQHAGGGCGWPWLQLAAAAWLVPWACLPSRVVFHWHELPGSAGAEPGRALPLARRLRSLRRRRRQPPR